MRVFGFSPTDAATALLFCGIYLWGLSYVSVLPPFEGFDEPAHYSYIEQLAWSGTRPHHGDPMSAEVDAYLADAPAVEAMHAPWTYGSFFVATPATVARGRQAAKERTEPTGAWSPGSIPNWEAQHPPLYYAVMAPIARLTAGLTLSGKLLALRVASYTIACAGLLLGCMAARRLGRRMSDLDAKAIRLAPVLWPLLLPMWFPDMARLGNDCLVALVAGAVAWLTFKEPKVLGSRWQAALLGLVLGLGLLTKATFLPLAAATILLLCWDIRRSACRDKRAERVTRLGLCCLAAAVVSGWWYVGQALETGSLIGSSDTVNVGAHGGVLSMLKEHGSFASFLRIPYSYATSMIWAGSWSAVVPPVVFDVPVFAGALLVAIAAVVRLLRHRFTFAQRLAVATTVLFLCGLTFQSVYLIAVNGNPAPAWYLQSFLPILSLLLAAGIAEASRFRLPFGAFLALLAYTPVFLVLAVTAEVTYFSGCASTAPNSHQLTLSSATACLRHPASLLASMDVTALPYLGIALALPAILLLVSGLALAMACLRGTRTFALPH